MRDLLTVFIQFLKIDSIEHQVVQDGLLNYLHSNSQMIHILCSLISF